MNHAEAVVLISEKILRHDLLAEPHAKGDFDVDKYMDYFCAVEVKICVEKGKRGIQRNTPQKKKSS